MSDDLAKAIEEKKARLAEQAEAIQRELAELAELERLAAKHNLVVSAVGSVPQLNQPRNPAPFPQIPQISEPELPVLDGTIGSLIRAYRAHPNSPYQKLRRNVRNNYDHIIARIDAELGHKQLAEIDAELIMRVYESWAAGGKYSMGHSFAGKLRLLSSFGMNVLKDDAATRLSVIMSKLRFKIPEARVERLTTEHVKAIRAAAHREFGWHSMALAQALQFELMLKQGDVIGEWVPASEPGISDVFKGSEKWVRGLRWSNIDENMILRHTITTGRRNEPKEIDIDLKQAPMVLEELSLLGERPRSGPMIVCEASDLPWTQTEYRRKWRMIANEAGIPMNIKNMDSGKAEKPVPRTMPSGRIRTDGL